MSYRKDMPEEERKARNRAKAAAFRARQRISMENDPWYDVVVRWKKRIEDQRRLERRRSNLEVREAYNAYNREWHASQAENEEYHERKRESTRQWRLANPEASAESYRKWTEENDRSEYNLAWSRANADKRAESTRRRKALIKGASTIESFTKAEIWSRDIGICGICGRPANSSNWHLDHIIPLSRGGQHTRDNVQVSHPKCNLSKKAKLPSEMAKA